MVSGIKGRLSWDLASFGKSFCQQTTAEVHEQGPEPDGKWDYREYVMRFGKSFCQQTPAEVHEQGSEPDGKWN
jgi:hypothetical protein